MTARILLIEDDAAVRLTIQRILQRGGYLVDCAADGALGLAAFAELAPDLVISDLVMPNKEGLEAIRELRALAPACRIVAISGGGRLNNMDLLSYAAQAGADAVLAKPFTPQQLLDVVAKALPAAVGATAS
jgi:CheY-like chemotaxis protein